VTEDITAQQTRQRLLDAGLAVFSEVGYHGATIREMAGRAGTNIAAISYHFGGKDGLYTAVVRSAFTLAAGDLSTSIAGSDLPEERLRRLVRALVCGATDDTLDVQRARLLAWDTLERTTRGMTWSAGYQPPFVTTMGHAIADVLHTDAAPGELSMLAIWLVGQCLAFQQVRHLLPEREAQAMMDPQVRDAIAEVVYWLARAGLAAYRGEPELAAHGARMAAG
jgi:AcrR family transcriptional regulator